MIKGSKLIGRSVVDMEAAEKLGKVKEIIVQQDGERVAGFVVSHSENILGSGGTRRTIPASALNAIGPDAITVRSGGGTDHPELDSLPRMSDVIGHKMVTQSGRMLGTIDDVLLEPKDGTIIGFTVGEDMKSKLENMFSADRGHTAGYVRADADLHVGNDLIVVPDDAFVAGDPEALAHAPEAASPSSDPKSQSDRWGTAPRAGTESRKSLWTKRTPESGATSGSDEVEGWIPGDFSKSLSDEPKPAQGVAPAPRVDPETSSAPDLPNPERRE